MFSHFALISVELANSFWPRKLSAAPIGVFFKCEAPLEAYVEHFVLRLQIVDEQETVGFPRCLLIQPVQLLLRQQGAELLHHGVQLVLVAQPPAAEELRVHPHGCADEPQLLRAHPGADLRVPASDEERVQGAVRLVQLRRVSKVVDDYKHLVQFLHFQFLGRLRDLALLLDDAPQRRLVPLVPVGLLPLRVHPQVLLDVLLDGDPAIVYVDTRAEDVNSLKDCSRIRLIRATVLPDFDGPRKMPVHGTRGTTGSEACLLVYSVVGKSLIFPIRPFALLPKFEAGKPGETGNNPAPSTGLTGAILRPAQD